MSPAPSMVAEFRLIRLIGRGGMGEVYLGHDTLLDRPVAVKLILPQSLASAPQSHHLTEARAAARIQHPNVVTVHRVGEVDGRAFIVTELIRGTSLDEIAIPLPQARMMTVAIGLARGLAAAHRQGVLHRDIKPGNAIFTEDGEVKLLDFGLAKLVDLDALRDPTLGISSANQKQSGVVNIAGPRQLPSVPDLDPARDSAPPSLPPSSKSDALVTQRLEQRETAAMDDDGMIVGTPLYMAPEIWDGQPASRRSDVYSMGVVLFEMCAGCTPFAGIPVFQLALRVISRDAPPVESIAAAIEPKLAEIINRCLARDPRKRFASGEELRDALEQVQARLLSPPIPEGNPYRGLLSFEAEHRALFFGRDMEIGTILDRLRSDAFVCVAGDSGAGKSSLCRAGVVPRVLEGTLDPRRSFHAVELIPGRRPLEALAAALSPVLKRSEGQLAKTIRQEPAALRVLLTAHLGADKGLLLFVDQLEELLTISDPAEASAVSEALSRLVIRNTGIRLLTTVRGDFLARATALAGLGDELTHALYLLRPLSPDKIREAIVGPSRAKGATFESEELITSIIASTARAEGGLPLLQFALAELWEAKDAASNVITARSLEQIGGVEGALARHADHVLDRMPAAHQAAARRILGSLVTLERTRARRMEHELVAGDPSARAALDALVRGRLLVAREAQGGTACEIAHEALLTGWFSLRRWLDEQAEARAVKSRLEQASADWTRLGKHREALWGPVQLAEAKRLDPLTMNGEEQGFLDASQRRVRRVRLLKMGLLVLVPALIVSLYGIAALRARSEVESQITSGLRSATAALAEAELRKAELDSLERRTFEAFDGQKRDEGERLWSEARRASAELDARYRDAARDAQTALALDNGRADVQKKLAEILYRRVLQAERSHNAALIEELRERLSAHDASGEFGKLLLAPAHLRVETEPAGAEVQLETIALEPEATARITSSRELGPTPISGLDLTPGSYVLTLKAPGTVAVRYPFVARRGEDLPLRIALPKEEQIPQGFIYVPEGRFLFGSSDDESLRRAFFVTAPMHDLRTDSYLIARNETTFGEWIHYLRTLPKDDPLRQPLRAGAGGITGSLELEESADGMFQLTLQLATQKVTARSDEPLVIRTRKERASQDWLRMPIAGMSLEAVHRYIGWLGLTGRVPGARLCTENEWERAARGADGRAYPHGQVLRPEDANFDQTYGKDPDRMAPDEIGAHPLSTSPFGVNDMPGNVFEWVQSSLDAGEIVGRGGAYFFDEIQAQAANRIVIDPSIRDPRLGVRVCASFHPR